MKLENKNGNAGWAVLGFFLPLVGLILWLIWKDDREGDGKMAGKGALIGAIVYIIVIVIMFSMSAFMFNKAEQTIDNIYLSVFHR